MSITITANVVSWYAAIVSTLVLFIGILQYLRERVHVVVECKSNYRVIGQGLYKNDTDYIIITVKNKGRRPITIKSVGFITKKQNGKNGLLTDSLSNGSRELSEGKSTDYLLEQELVDMNSIKHFVAYDQAGRKFKGKLKKRY